MRSDDLPTKMSVNFIVWIIKIVRVCLTMSQLPLNCETALKVHPKNLVPLCLCFFIKLFKRLKRTMSTKILAFHHKNGNSMYKAYKDNNNIQITEAN